MTMTEDRPITETPWLDPDVEPKRRFGVMLRHYRQSMGISQRQLAKAAEVEAGGEVVSHGYIAKIERGDGGARPGRNIVVNLARALNRPEEEFLTMAGWPATGPRRVKAEGVSFPSFVQGLPELKPPYKRVLIASYRVMVEDPPPS